MVMAVTSTQALEKKQQRVGKVLGMLPGLHTMPPVIARSLYWLLDRGLGLPKQAMAHIQKLTIPLTTEPGQSISATAYYPSIKDHHKALVFFHGGGCVIGSSATHDRFCRYLAKKNNIAIISINYRLAPEFKFPQPIIDVIEAWNWVNQNHHALQLEQGAIGVCGDSAGGYLSALVGLASLHQNLSVQSHFRPAYQALLYPMLDLHADSQSYQDNQADLILTKNVMHYFRDHYLNSSSEYASPLASPLLADNLSESPKTYLLTLGHDPLCDEGIQYAGKLRDQGVDLVHEHYADCMHSFISVARVSHHARQATDRVCDAIKQLMA